MISERKRGEGIELGERGSLWAVVLAGEPGTRLRPLVRHRCGDERPKQFSPLLGGRTLLGQTLDRVGRLIPPERTVVVTLPAHARYLDRELSETPRLRVLRQPENRGTAAGILLAAQWIETQDPGATLVCFPPDHLVLDDADFMEHVAELAGFVKRTPRWIVLLGGPPNRSETEYGWIEPGERVGWTGQGPIYAVRLFRGKPPKGAGEGPLLRGSPWNTFLFTARATAVLSAGRESAPALYDGLARLRTFAGSGPDRWAVRHAYERAPTLDFSRSILEACPRMLAMSKLPGLTWCDLGSPAQVVKMPTRLDVSTPWLATYTA